MAWNGSDSSKIKLEDIEFKTNHRTLSHLRYILSTGLIIFLLVGLSVWLIIGKEKPSIAESKHDIKLTTPIRIKEVPPEVSRQTVETNSFNKPEETNPSKVRVKTFSIITNRADQIVECYQTADGKTHKWIRPARPPVFTHGTDDLISMALSSGSGSMPPLPLSGNMDKEFLKSLEEPIIIEPADSDDIKERKRIVREARLEIKKLMDQGMHFSEIMADHEKVFNDNAEIRATAIAEATKIRDEGDTEGTAQYVETINAAFESMGIEKIDAPKTKEERRAEHKTRREAITAARANKEK